MKHILLILTILSCLSSIFAGFVAWPIYLEHKCLIKTYIYKSNPACNKN
jgi:uncharacterized membrane protein required for colicin V production